MFAHRVRFSGKATAEVMIVVGEARIFVKRSPDRPDIVVAVDAPRHVLIEAGMRFPEAPMPEPAFVEPDPLQGLLRPNRRILSITKG